MFYEPTIAESLPAPIASGALAFHAVESNMPWQVVTLSERHDVRCLIGADDYDWLSRWRWNFGWHAKTKWKFYAKRNDGPARDTIYMHREILIRATPGAGAEFFAAHHAHHGNGQSLDNRKANLAWTTPAVNSSIRVKRGEVPTLEEIIAGLMAGQAAQAQVPY